MKRKLTAAWKAEIKLHGGGTSKAKVEKFRVETDNEYYYEYDLTREYLSEGYNREPYIKTYSALQKAKGAFELESKGIKIKWTKIKLGLLKI